MNHVSAFANNWLGDINFKSFFFFCIYLSIFIFIQFPYSNAVLYEDYVSMKINYYCWSLWSTTLTSCYFTIHSFLLEISTTYHYTSFPFCMAIFFSLSLYDSVTCWKEDKNAFISMQNFVWTRRLLSTVHINKRLQICKRQRRRWCLAVSVSMTKWPV